MGENDNIATIASINQAFVKGKADAGRERVRGYEQCHDHELLQAFH